MSSPVYSPSFLKSIERTTTRERLKCYLRATGQDLPEALALYEQNVALSEALYGLLHWLEVAVRNAAGGVLAVGYQTPAWYDHAPFPPYWQAEVSKAKLRARTCLEKWWRNLRSDFGWSRISHRERVLTSRNVLYAGFDFITPAELVECVEWTCLETALWMKTQHRYSKASRILADVRSMNILL